MTGVSSSEFYQEPIYTSSNRQPPKSVINKTMSACTQQLTKVVPIKRNCY